MSDRNPKAKPKYNSSSYLNFSNNFGNFTNQSHNSTLKAIEEINEVNDPSFEGSLKGANLRKIFRNMFSMEAGKTINNLKAANKLMKSNNFELDK